MSEVTTEGLGEYYHEVQMVKLQISVDDVIMGYRYDKKYRLYDPNIMEQIMTDIEAIIRFHQYP